VQQNEDYVLKVLQDVGLVSRKQIEGARKHLNGQNNVVDLLIKNGIVTESDVSRSLAAQAHMDWIDLSSMLIPPAIIKQIRAEDARRFKVIPVAFGETGLVVAVSDPLDIDTIDSLSFLLQRELACGGRANLLHVQTANAWWHQGRKWQFDIGQLYPRSVRKQLRLLHRIR
jgi:type IV pilus assembly protein PilB